VSPLAWIRTTCLASRPCRLGSFASPVVTIDPPATAPPPRRPPTRSRSVGLPPFASTASCPAYVTCADLPHRSRPPPPCCPPTCTCSTGPPPVRRRFVRTSLVHREHLHPPAAVASTMPGQTCPAYNGHLHPPAAIASIVLVRHVARLGCTESACCERIFHVFQSYVAGVSYGCCKSIFGCCISCHG
jgi:hypothetical protein